MASTDTDIGIDLGKYQLGWADEEDYVFKPKKGLNEAILREMSWLKGEPDWMLDFRLKSHQRFERRPRPSWGGDTSDLNFDDIYYYIKPKGNLSDDWDEVPESIKNTYEKLGIPQAERKYLAGVTAQYESDPEAYTLPRRKRITYVWLSPDMLADSVPVDDAAVQDLYEQRSDEYDRPEMRLVERLVFPDDAAAQAAARSAAAVLSLI